MYRRIVVPLDGSEIAESILPHVKDMAVAHQAEVILLRVLPATGVLPSAAEREAMEARNYLSAVEKRLQQQKVNPRFSVRQGEDAAAEITDYAEVNDVDLIAMSTHGRSIRQRRGEGAARHQQADPPRPCAGHLQGRSAPAYGVETLGEGKTFNRSSAPPPSARCRSRLRSPSSPPAHTTSSWGRCERASSI